MKITANLLLAASFFCLVACSESGNNQNADTAKLEDLGGSADPGLTPIAPAAGTAPGQNNTPAAANTAGVTLNPPHGQPGHDCAVPVGQPLTGASASASKPVQPFDADVSVMTNEAPAAPANPTTAPGMNPPHGQPGHDCAIPVGAPLKK